MLTLIAGVEIIGLKHRLQQSRKVEMFARANKDNDEARVTLLSTFCNVEIALPLSFLHHSLVLPLSHQ
jgi:hypothetical protein